MQDVQNIPTPDVNSTEGDDDFGSHSSVHEDEDIEQPTDIKPNPADRERNVPIEEPPAEDGEEESRRIL